MRFLATLRFARNDRPFKGLGGISGGKAAADSYIPPPDALSFRPQGGMFSFTTTAVIPQGGISSFL
jgi:hypothetical protein